MEGNNWIPQGTYAKRLDSWSNFQLFPSISQLFHQDGLKNLELRGQHEDGNAGLVMSRAGKLLLRCGTSDCVVLAEELLRKGRQLIEAAQDEEVNLAHEVLEIDPPQRFF